VQQFPETAAEECTVRDGGKRGVGALLLSLDPRACLGALLIFEPAIGIGDDGAAISIFHRINTRLRWTLCRG